MQKKAANNDNKKMRILYLCVAAVAVVVVVLGITLNREKPEGATMAADPIGTYYATIEVEGYGTIELELYGDVAPVTVANFVELAESGYYDGLTFHRIIKDFVMQGGDIDGDGLNNGDVESIVGEFAQNGYTNDILHERGVISMARSSDPNSASTQFFICHADTPRLDGKYAAFGKVVSGMEVVDAVCEAAEPLDRNGTIAPEAQPVMTSVIIHE